MANIHPSSIVEPGARLHPSVQVGPFCVIGDGVTIGEGTRLISHVTILGKTTIGTDNTIWPQATLGGDPQDIKFTGEDTELIVGDNNSIRESVTMHLGTANGGGKTKVGSNNLFMIGAHIAHDCVVGDHCVLGNNVLLAGHVLVENNAILSGGAGISHYVTIGQYAFIGGFAGVVHDCPPFMVSDGHPSRARAVNTVGLKRHRFPEQTIDNLKAAHRMLFRTGENGESEDGRAKTVAENLVRLERDYPDDECIGILVKFVRNTSIGIKGRYLESTRRDNKWVNPTK